MNNESEDLSRHYDDNFYSGQAPASYRSATIYARHLWQFIQPHSVVDIGCGRGTWLKAFKELGAKQLTGIDGSWNSQEQMIDSDIDFVPAELNHAIEIKGFYDLAISLEVAEHLDPNAADTFIRTITSLSDTILFGAAYPGQGGTNHINEQLPSWWARRFIAKHYLPFDLFRPAFWGNADVKFWYRQNTFLYVRKGSAAFSSLLEHGLSQITDIAFMDCVHPELHSRTIMRGRMGYKLRNIIRPLLPASVLRTIGRLRGGTSP